MREKQQEFTAEDCRYIIIIIIIIIIIVCIE